ncbi:hypothetical protein MLD38_009149 [Melastoma candidum]|uniref:Uncharacterized protein n=1 Tax=Melastoma candidum TaxID=119954 RepID=A0ACB9RW96_9MYRT|nr:hypothetical protein MLD38_009149 [Melastoma candidum]
MKSSSSRIRFLHCFKPETSPGSHLLQDGPPSEEHLTYRDIAGEPSPCLPSRKGTLSRAVKAVLFKTVLAHRVRERRRRRLNKSYVSINSGMTVADCLDDEAARDDNTSSITRLSRLPSVSEPYSSLEKFTLLSESQDGVADHMTGVKGKNMRIRRKRMICAFIIVLAVTVLLGRTDDNEAARFIVETTVAD